MTLRIGSLCSGYGGLDLAIEQFFGAETAWFSEFEKAPSRILEHHWPGVPNLGDMTQIDWSGVEPVDIIAGGTPCQDLSGAGKRRGMTEGTRSNLWVQMREAIAVIRPAVVVWENVRGAYSACAESEIDSELGRCPRCANPGGGADHAPNLRALGRVLGDLDGLGFDAEWVGLRASDAGAPHERFRVFVVAYRRGESAEFWSNFRAGQRGARSSAAAVLKADLLPTIMAAEGVKATTRQGVAQKGETGQIWLTNVAHDLIRPDALLPTPIVSDSMDAARHTTSTGVAHSGTSLTDAMRLLPTPNAAVSNDREGPDTWIARAARVKEETGANNGMPLTIVSQLFPTPTTAIATGGNAVRGGDRSDEKLLPGIVQDDLPQPVGLEGSPLTPEAYEELWASLDDQSPYWVTVDGKDYWPAVQRWAQVLGRPAPAPTLPDGKGGRHRLSARLTEWMMGQQDRWITDPAIGLSRNDQLKACGNGVVTQQCGLALSIAWPRVLEAVAA